MLGKGSLKGNILGKLTQLYTVQFLPGGFTQMLVVDGFDRKNYDFEFVKKEFLGEVRTVVFDVRPKQEGRGFLGRIWAEDQDYNIVRFNGTYGQSTSTKMYFHFDSWREFMGNGEWLPGIRLPGRIGQGLYVGRSPSSVSKARHGFGAITPQNPAHKMN
jgi:hypothetical protein